MRDIDVSKITESPTNGFEAVDILVNRNQDLIEALHIMKSTIENFEDVESLKLNKERMIKYFNRFAKDEILSK